MDIEWIKKEIVQSMEQERIKSLRKEQENKVRNFKWMNQFAHRRQIVFTGSSLMEMFPICEYCTNDVWGKHVYNRGIGGFTTDDFLKNINPMLLDLEPSVVFINIGTNDIRSFEEDKGWMDHLLSNYDKILNIIKEKLPQTKVYVMAYYPSNANLPEQDEKTRAWVSTRSEDIMSMVNHEVRKLAEKTGYTYIDVNAGLTDENGDLKKEYTIEGVHMYAEAYRVVYENLKSLLAE